MAIVPAVTKNVKSDNMLFNLTPRTIIKLKFISIFFLILILGIVIGGTIQYYDISPSSIYSYYFGIILLTIMTFFIIKDLYKYIDKWVY